MPHPRLLPWLCPLLLSPALAFATPPAADQDTPVAVVAPAVDNDVIAPEAAPAGPVAVAAPVDGDRAAPVATPAGPIIPVANASHGDAAPRTTPAADSRSIADAGLGTSAAADHSGATDNAAPDSDAPASVGPLQLLGGTIAPGEFNTLHWHPPQSFTSIATPVPVLVARGAQPGPTLCLTAAIHGDELNGIEMVRRLMFELEPRELAGTVIGVPIVNLEGFRRGERYLTDRRDLNRHFPGTEDGSSAGRIAYSLFDQVIRHCDYLADLHTGSQRRINHAQIRGDLRHENIVAFARQFGGITVLHGKAASGTLRDAAVAAGIPAVTLEAGGPHRLEDDAVEAGVKALETLLDNLGVRKAKRLWRTPQPVFYESRWLRAPQGGILLSNVRLNQAVRAGEVLGTVTDPVSNTGSAIIAPFDGRLLGMAENQVVHTGFAAYHLGVEKRVEDVQEDARREEQQSPTPPSDDDGPSMSGSAPADVDTEAP